MKKIVLSKSDIYALIALILLTFAFTIPILGFLNVTDKIKSNNIDSIPAYSYPLWNVYQTGRYVSPYVPAGAERDLKEMIERRGEIGVASLPIWFVSLEAPNYPKESFPNGIPVYFHLDGYSGDVEEMNTINHFIGMYPMEAGGKIERKISPILMILISICMIVFILVKHKLSVLLMLPSLLFNMFFFILYTGWLYWYGHNLQDWGMFKIKPFMPTALGEGKVAQFTTHSYPAIGFYILVIIAILSLLAILSRLKEIKMKQVE